MPDRITRIENTIHILHCTKGDSILNASVYIVTLLVVFSGTAIFVVILHDGVVCILGCGKCC